MKVSEFSKMGEYDVKQWLIKHCIMDGEQYEHNGKTLIRPIESLAECAFRLRDEYIKEKSAMDWEWLLHKFFALLGKTPTIPRTIHEATPSHWIAAALLAKGELE